MYFGIRYFVRSRVLCIGPCGMKEFHGIVGGGGDDWTPR